MNTRGAFNLAKIFGLKLRKLSVPSEKAFSVLAKGLVLSSKLVISLRDKKRTCVVQKFELRMKN